MNPEAKFGLFACNRNELPLIETIWPTPSVCRAIFSILATAALVRSSEVESGNCTLTIRRPWSCCGIKPVGAQAEDDEPSAPAARRKPAAPRRRSATAGRSTSHSRR